MKKPLIFLIIFSCFYTITQAQDNHRRYAIEEPDEWEIIIENPTGAYIVDVSLAVTYTDGEVKKTIIKDLEVVARKSHRFKPTCCVEKITISGTAKKWFATKPIEIHSWGIKESSIGAGEVKLVFGGNYDDPSIIIIHNQAY